MKSKKDKKTVSRTSSLKVKSRTENLVRIRSFISGTARELGFSSATIDNIILAVDEACTNIIKHAYRSFPDGEIIIRLKYLNKKLIISITDYGNSFEPALIPEPDLKKYYEQHRVGGLGMYLMKTLMDDVKYTSVPGKYNQVLLSKSLNSAG